MPRKNISNVFAPQSIAVIGANPREDSVGYVVLKNLLKNPSPRLIYAVNPKYRTVGDCPCFPSVSALPEVVDLVVICTPASTVLQIVSECGRAGVRGVVIISAGFREAGAAGVELEAELLRLAKQFPDMRILGPNCLGFMMPHQTLNVSFVEGMPQPGRVAFLSQSGALGSAVLDWAMQENIGFSCFVSLGNMLDINLADLIDYLADDPWTESIILYIESITEARHFMSAARAFSRDKPIIAYKAGRFAESAKAAASHTGALAGVDQVYEAAFSRAGIVRVLEIDDLFDCAELLAKQNIPAGPNLAIVTNAGGPGVIAADALLARRGKLAQLSEQTMSTLNLQLPAAWSHGNPVDILGDAKPERFALATEAILHDLAVDGLLIILSPQAMTDPTASAQAVIQATQQTHKPVLASWMGGQRVAEGQRLLANAGIPCYLSPEKAVRAFTYLDAYAQRKKGLYEVPRDVTVAFSTSRHKLRTDFSERLSGDSNMLSELESKAVLEAYEIPVVKSLLAKTESEAVSISQQLGFPVALKICSPSISHKTEVGGVELNLANAEEVIAAYRRMMDRVKLHRPDAVPCDVTLQRMCTHPTGYELIIGAKRDPVFGVVMLVGMGGIAVEVMQDQALELPPLNERLARRMLESLRCWPLLRGFRGRPAVQIDQLVEVLIRCSYLVADHPEIAEFDINPLLATPTEVVALDARIRLDCSSNASSLKPYSHLAIRPYPEEFEKNVRLTSGEAVLLRPITPEDEPRWHTLVQCCSSETLHLRFRYVFKAASHEMATRFCVLDYDREIAIVAEQGTNAERRLLGVGQLIADADHTTAEFAIMVGDPWQGRGIGSLIIDHCLEVCRQWGIRRVTAETAQENTRMIRMFQHRGFHLDSVHHADTVRVIKELP